jgi:hypothetical protein
VQLFNAIERDEWEPIFDHKNPVGWEQESSQETAVHLSAGDPVGDTGQS